MATVSIILRTDKIKKDGTAPLHFLIIKDRKKSKITTGISIDPKHWNEQKQMVKPGATNSARLNSILKNKLAELQDNVFEHLTIAKSLTTKKLKEKIYGRTPTNFFEFCDDVLAIYEKQNMFGTYDKSKGILSKLETFYGSRNLVFQDITPQFLEKYDTYCRKVWQNKTNTIHKDLKCIRKVFNDAIRLDMVDIQENPFLKYKLKTEKTTRSFLTESELAAIAEAPCSPGTRKELHRDMFVFASYVGGLRVSDVLSLKWKNITDTHVTITVRKTGGQLSIKLPGTAQAILDKYRAEERTADFYVFPMMPDDLDENDLRRVDKEISSATSYINKNLQKIGEDIGLTKHISFHISRHTFATRLLRKGASIDKVSKILGHSAIKETQIYAKIVNEELDKAMDLLEDPALKYA